MSQPQSHTEQPDQPADLAAIHAAWSQTPNPSIEDAGAYLAALRGLETRDEAPGPPEEEPEIETAGQLWALCRHWQERFQELKAESTLTTPPIVGFVSSAWQSLRHLAGASSYPNEPPPPAGYADAVRALDPVINWCSQRMGGAGAQTGQTVVQTGQAPAPTAQAVPSVHLGGQADDPIVRGKQKEYLRSTQYNVVKALLQAGKAGLTKKQLVERSGHTDAVGILKRLANSDPDWKAVISLPRTSGKGYRIK
jgi:hypothetical protein